MPQQCVYEYVHVLRIGILAILRHPIVRKKAMNEFVCQHAEKFLVRVPTFYDDGTGERSWVSADHEYVDMIPDEGEARSPANAGKNHRRDPLPFLLVPDDACPDILDGRSLPVLPLWLGLYPADENRIEKAIV